MIFAHLSGWLDQHVAVRYGRSPLAAIRVQAEQLRLRFEAMARWQAAWAGEGWRIERVEAGPEDGQAHLIVDGEKMVLKGRIDRMDVNLRTGARVVLDYKTSETARPPDKKHRDGDQWIDLQLPLYRHLVRGMGIEGSIGLGYVALPKDVRGVAFLPAEWSEEELAGADRKAEEVVRKVRDEVFWPPTTPPPEFFEEFSAICQDNRFGFVHLGDEEGAVE